MPPRACILKAWEAPPPLPPLVPPPVPPLLHAEQAPQHDACLRCVPCRKAAYAMQQAMLHAALQPALRPMAQRATQPRVIRAAAAAAAGRSPAFPSSPPPDDRLESWQVTRLQQALAAGRRQVKVRCCCATSAGRASPIALPALSAHALSGCLFLPPARHPSLPMPPPPPGPIPPNAFPGGEAVQGAGPVARRRAALAQGRAAARPVRSRSAGRAYIHASARRLAPQLAAAQHLPCQHARAAVPAPASLPHPAPACAARPSCPASPRAQQSLLEARAAAEVAAQERAAVLRAAKQQGGGTTAGASGTSAGGRPGGARQGPAGGGRGGDGAPAWRSYSKKKALGRQAEATLEMIFTRTQVGAGHGAARVQRRLNVSRAHNSQFARCRPTRCACQHATSVPGPPRRRCCT